MSQDIVDAIATGNLDKVLLTKQDQALLTYVKLLTLNPAQTRDSDVAAMREAGWSDEQIWEATFEVGMFSFLNRMADAHGLDYPSGGWYPPQLRAKMEGEKPKEKEKNDTVPPAKGK